MPTACQKGGQRMSLLAACAPATRSLPACTDERNWKALQPEEGKLRRDCVWWVKWKKEMRTSAFCAERTVITGYPLVTRLYILFLWNLIQPKLKANLEMVFSHIMAVYCGGFGWAHGRPLGLAQYLQYSWSFRKVWPPSGVAPSPFKKLRINHWIL